MEKGKLMKVLAAEAIALSPEVKAALGQMGEIMRSMAGAIQKQLISYLLTYFQKDTASMTENRLAITS